MSDFASVRKQKRIETENRRRTERRAYRTRYQRTIIGLLFHSAVSAGFFYFTLAPAKTMSLFNQSISPSLVDGIAYAGSLGVTVLLLGVAMQAHSVIRSRRALRHHQKKRSEKPLVDAREQDTEELVER